MPKFSPSLAAYAAAALALSLPSQAQDTTAGVEFFNKGGCFTCHGNLAAGGGDPAAPQGPDLRGSQLDRAALIETISCGRPTTEMPMHLIGAYTEVACYGMPVGPKPDDVKGEGVLTAEEIEALADFLLAQVVPQGDITKEYCALFFGGNQNAPACRQY